MTLLHVFLMLPPAMIVAMGPVSCLQTAPVYQLSAACVQHGQSRLHLLSHTPLKETRGASTARPKHQYSRLIIKVKTASSCIHI